MRKALDYDYIQVNDVMTKTTKTDQAKKKEV